MYCPHCGALNPNDTDVCLACGQPLDRTAAPGVAPPPVPPPAPPVAPGAYGPQPGYGGPEGGYYPPGYAPAPRPPMPPNYLWQSIVVTLLCCWPLGIPAIVYASQVQSKYLQGDFGGAARASQNARNWAIAAAVAAAVGLLFYLLAVVFLGSMSSTTGTY